MSTAPTPGKRHGSLFYTMTDTRLVDLITWELRISLGFAVRDSLPAIERMDLDERSDYIVNVVRRCSCGSRKCGTHLENLAPDLIGNVGEHAYDKGVGDSIFAFALSDTLLLAPDLGQLLIRNHIDWPDGQAIHGAISVRRLVRGIVDNCWEAGYDPDPVIQYAMDKVMVPLEGLRQHLKVTKLS